LSKPTGRPPLLPRLPKAASHALATSEQLLGQAKSASGDEPAWIDFYARHEALHYRMEVKGLHRRPVIAKCQKREAA
jgi:hypothetical protein